MKPKLFVFQASTKIAIESLEQTVERGLGVLSFIMYSFIQQIFTERFYLPGTALDPGETSVNKTQSLPAVLRA